MCQHAGCPPHICYIIPPYMTEQVATNAPDPAMRRRALRNLYHQGQLRGMRTAMNQFAFAGLGTGTKRRTVYDAQHGGDLPGTLVRSEDQAAGKDVAVNEAYDYAGTTYDFYFDVMKRNSVDDKGMRLDSTVHYSTDYDNAFWNGQQMVYGDGDGEIFDRFTKCLDVIGHELTHGVTQFTAGLTYSSQSGALNESFSDVFGSLIKQYAAGDTADKADWLIGEGLLIPKAGTNRTALRSMKAPGTAYDDPTLGKDPQPATMKDYYSGSDDNYGVHINSGIPNHAFYLAATAIGGKAWEVAGLIWYETLTTRLQLWSEFKDAAAATREVAQKHGTAAAKAVDDAWTAVGL
ncbi:M4 family metallopeptidase [Nitrospirillum sp. BR 11828]|uniref:M4 family metallopeptidase n=1 Tax=Nitrospirillum sp. BR 11828 TaxID=3104325 RepID=UPI002ACA92A6|nr:M4 family metallopeptidase [Nitrospirillum sp. BR 11828]MDZ5648842.1 M4 family metallopeptidase [Nitrospirillum sp. BR 11828]